MSLMPAISPSLLPLVISTDRDSPAVMGGIPARNQLAALFVKRDGVWVDTIGESAAALWAALPTTHRSIYLVDENTLRSAETIITNIEASEYLNDGGELVGTNAKVYAQYADGTSEATLRKAYRYFGLAYPITYWQRVDGSNILRTDGTPIEVFG